MNSKKIINALNKSRTNVNDLRELMLALGFTEYPGPSKFMIGWKDEWSPHVPFQILNLGTTRGTHWVACDNVNGRYFDPLGSLPFSGIPWHYEYVELTVQDFDYGHCGQYCCLFLAYSRDNEVDRFYNGFIDPNVLTTS